MPDDNFYEGYSLWHTFGYGPQGEVDRARKALASLGYDSSDCAIRELLELTRDLHRLVKAECQDQVVALRDRSKRLVIAGQAPPFDVSLAIQLASVILLAAQTGVLVLDYLRKQRSSSFENSDILEAAFKKLSIKKDTHDLIVEKTERWRILHKKKGRK